LLSVRYFSYLVFRYYIIIPVLSYYSSTDGTGYTKLYAELSAA
jgi:hypothetical protein